MNPRRVLLSWSSGKDSAWTLYRLRAEPRTEVVGLLTSFNQTANRVSMHAVRRELVEAQAAELDLPLWPVLLPDPCSNETYEREMARAFTRARQEHATHIAFGDLFLEDVRDYRIGQLKGTGVEPLFPLWGTSATTPGLAKSMLGGGLKAIVTCVDTQKLPETFLGRTFDRTFLSELPPHVDRCGEWGEFHTFCSGGPMFRREVPVRAGKTVRSGQFGFADLLLGNDSVSPASPGEEAEERILRLDTHRG
jgi:uncharacterized protein (TIGR00290 family)